MKDTKTESSEVLQIAECRRTEDEEEDSSNDACAQRLRMRKKYKSMGTRNHINFNFIVGSCAEVERLWSEEDVILTKRRKKLIPIVLEEILFLKKNK